MNDAPQETPARAPVRKSSDLLFHAMLTLMGGAYILLIVAMVVADTAFTSPRHLWQALASPEIRYSIRLSLITCTLTAILSLWVAVPLGYLLSRREFRGKGLIDAILDIPIVLPPLVIGLSLLILFQTPGGRWIERFLPLTYAPPGVVLAQFSVACAFAVRTMRVTFDQMNPRNEQVALTLGCTRAQAFWLVVLPEARRGALTAVTLAWARALGEFGPILVFSGATRMKTEVLSTTVFLELSVGSLEAAVAVSMLMILAAVGVLLLVRYLGSESALGRTFQP
jgi:molybdate transport system permease protein